MTRPALPRTSSGTSGFFFCGMMLEPVQKASGSSTKPNCCEVQITSSSHQRDRWTAVSDAAAQNSTAKSRSLTASRELAVTPSNPSAAAVAARSMGNVVPARAAAPRGDRLSRTRQSANRARSRCAISNHASM